MKVLISALLFLSLASNIFAAHPANVQDISSREYYSAVKEVIDNARQSIAVAMFSISLDEDNEKSRVYKLCNSLVEAKNRGVDVRIILDQNVNFVHMDKYNTWEIEGKNRNAYNYFKENDMHVFYDDKTKYLHSKVIVVDEEIVITGSTNWSHAALTQNNETSVLIRSTGLAKSILDSFLKIKIDTSVPEEKEEEELLFPVYMDFMENEDLAGRMITKHDERAFDLYLLLIYTYKGKDTIDFDFDLYAEYLGMDEKMNAGAYRRQIIKVLKKLRDDYGLIEAEFYHGQNAEVKLLGIEDKSKPYEHPLENYFLIPEKYFSYGWNRELSFRAKYCYLINRYMLLGSTGEYSWSASREDIGGKFHLIPGTITDGMMELKKQNLIEVEQSDIEEGYEKRSPARYKMLDLYSPKEHAKTFVRLTKQYGKYDLNDAVKFAEIVFKENDTVIIEDIIKLTRECGREHVKEAYDIVAQKAEDNPKRTHRYAVGIIKRLRKEELEKQEEIMQENYKSD
ncbi:phospholipase D-like domain-containing protein [Elusimicrobiota bacterium]